jgi:hypothetical protein
MWLNLHSIEQKYIEYVTGEKGKKEERTYMIKMLNLAEQYNYE